MEQMKQEIENRIALYALISRLMLIEVDDTLLDSIESDEAMLALFPNYQGWSKRQELSRQELIDNYYNVDFANLFLMHLVPYESFYTREDQMIESGGDNPVIELYNELDFRVELDKARVVSADHIGVELEFMYMLCTAQKKALEADDKEGMCELLQVQRAFLKEHLLEWVPMFLINAKRESRTPLYHDGTELTLEFLLSDFEYITQMLATHCSEDTENE
ncbi:TorD/DmsD family molecular chaperone [Sulfurovum mangrovi]|uniref:TorD/DmsD family molecular chaperone n=1 Tax=Sulfurovum mangrovi TaxID=2893889 RepID=UPI001E4299CC|nr:molecular chaperone TorD family protein [Sulfurovum mangrovi]UFH59735.1 molecular chaperone TorD family protein [Sulfurovum mangrovi]UFH60878.1 molecular chaperone TorD family protein [Sulfurovum mangrovi]